MAMTIGEASAAQTLITALIERQGTDPVDERTHAAITTLADRSNRTLGAGLDGKRAAAALDEASEAAWGGGE